MMVAPVATAEAKLFASLSHLVEMRRQSLGQQEARSIRLRARYAWVARGIGVFCDLVDGMRASVAVPAWRTQAVCVVAPVGEQPWRRPVEPLRRGRDVGPVSWAEGEGNGLPASVNAWMFVVGPPRERPMARVVATLFYHVPSGQSERQRCGCSTRRDNRAGETGR